MQEKQTKFLLSEKSYCLLNTEPTGRMTDFSFSFFLAVRLRFHGQAYVHWTERKRNRRNRRGRDKRRRTVHYRARETYFDHTVALIGKGTAFVT